MNTKKINEGSIAQNGDIERLANIVRMVRDGRGPEASSQGDPSHSPSYDARRMDAAAKGHIAPLRIVDTPAGPVSVDKNGNHQVGSNRPANLQ